MIPDEVHETGYVLPASHTVPIDGAVMVMVPVAETGIGKKERGKTTTTNPTSTRYIFRIRQKTRYSFI